MTLEQPQPEPEKRIKKETPSRLLTAIEMSLKPIIGEVRVIGKENLDKIQKDKKIVIATTHLSDVDIPLVVKALGKEFDIAISDQSTNHSLRLNPGGKIGLMFAGEDNFIPIDFKQEKQGRTAKFNPENFEAMSNAMNGGKEVVIAAHNPSYSGKLGDGGVGAVYLAQITGSVILPVSVNFHSEEPYIAGKNLIKTMKERPDVDVIIGEPINFDVIEGIKDFKDILDKRKRREKLDSSEIERFKMLSKSLKNQSEELMHALASKIPEEKRGPYDVGN